MSMSQGDLLLNKPGELTDMHPRVDVLGRLLVMQQSLSMLRNQAQMEDFIRLVFLDVPGVVECRVHLSVERGDGRAMPEDDSHVCIRIRSSHEDFGEIRLAVEDNEIYRAYEPFLDNTAQMVGTLLENRRNAARLTQANDKLNQLVDSLEQRVKERTQDILHAKNELAASEQRLGLALQATNDGLWDWDMESDRIFLSPRYYEMTGYHPEEVVPDQEFFRHIIHPDDWPRVLATMESYLNGESQADDIEYRMITKSGKICWMRGKATVGARDASGKALRMTGTISDITELKNARDSAARYVHQLEESVEGTLQAVANMVEQRDPYTAGHERRVSILAGDIAGEMGWPEEKCRELRLIGLVTDIGKIGVPAEILSKPGRLSPVEFDLVKGHAERGYEILRDVKFPMPIAEIIRQHHERMDGSGYPQGLKGGEILPEARILAVSDVVEAMVSHRPYRPALGLDAALGEIEAHRGTLYDAGVVDALLRLTREQGYKLPE